MDLAKIRELLKIVSESGVAEVEIEEDDFKLVVRRNAPNVTVQSPATAQPPIPYYSPAPAPPPFYPPAPAPPQVLPPVQVQMPQPTAPVAQPAAPATPAEPPAPEAPKPAASSANDHTINAPIVGTFYSAPSPDADPFVSVGDRVSKGDVLCIIEAMKLMNEIECEVPGTIKEILINNSEPVEYDQPLFIIEKS